MSRKAGIALSLPGGNLGSKLLAMPSGARIEWIFKTKKDGSKMGRAYPEPVTTHKSHGKDS
jgi:hypothetical protein